MVVKIVVEVSLEKVYSPKALESLSGISKKQKFFHFDACVKTQVSKIPLLANVR